MKPSALVITTAGINCERELAHAFALAGAAPQLVHLNRLIADPSLIEGYDLIGLPGGFSYGDAVAAGRIAAALIRRHLYEALVGALERGVPMICPCNGFQIACQAGLLPGPEALLHPPRPTVALGANAQSRFVDRWCRIEIPKRSRCIWTEGLEPAGDGAMLPIAHGEGRFVAETPDLLDRLDRDGQVAVRYAAGDNPNGSQADVAGICDATGLILGLMPHPERFTDWHLHPWWTRLDGPTRNAAPLGLAMFQNAVARVGKPAVTARKP